MSKHTPGPWEVSTFAAHTDKAGLPAGVYTVEDDGSDGDYVCMIETDWIEPDEAHANAQLIASAPELLEACKEARKAIIALENERANHLGIGATTSLMAMYLDAAITKAEGGTDAKVRTD